MGLFDSLSGLGSSLLHGFENIGDFIGLDGSLGYQGTWNTPIGLSAMQLNPRTAEMINNSTIPNGNSLAGFNPNTGMLSGLKNWTNSLTSKDIGNLSQLAKTGLGAYTSWQDMKRQDDLANMYKNQLAFNQAQILRSNKRQDEADKTLANAFNNSSLARGL